MPLSHAIPIKVGINTHAEVDLVDIKLVQQLGLKPCQNKNLPILRAINQQNLPTYGAYNLRLELTDAYAQQIAGKVQEALRQKQEFLKKYGARTQPEAAETSSAAVRTG